MPSGRWWAISLSGGCCGTWAARCIAGLQSKENAMTLFEFHRLPKFYKWLVCGWYLFKLGFQWCVCFAAAMVFMAYAARHPDYFTYGEIIAMFVIACVLCRLWRSPKW